MAGENDRVIYVDMTDQSVSIQPFPQDWKLLGGRALSARILTLIPEQGSYRVHSWLPSGAGADKVRSGDLNGDAADWPLAKSRELIAELIGFATQPQFVHAHEWRPGDLIVWDNRCTMHRARPYDDMTQRRVLHRTTVSDEINSVEQVEKNRAPR